MKENSLYIHIPYCGSKCIYCDFFSGGAGTARWDLFVEALLNELQTRKDELSGEPDTLYIGGGTPSLMPTDHFMRLVDGIGKILGKRCGWREFTIEVNPDDVDSAKCAAWRRGGVNRVSMGVQSLNDAELSAIRRRHDSSTAIDAYALLRKHFSNVSIDLMFGIPGQTLLSWEKTVRQSIELRPEHISAYSLMLEEGTPLTVLHRNGKVSLPGDDDVEKMWRILSEELRSAGYEQYEISNYSLPGFRSVHNSRYWAGSPYLGLGPSAHSYDGLSTRRFNPADTNGYLKWYGNHAMATLGKENQALFHDEEHLSEEELAEEYVMTRMRTVEGVSLDEYGSRFGDSRRGRLRENAKNLLARRMIEERGGCYVLTPEGIMVADRIIVSLCM